MAFDLKAIQEAEAEYIARADAIYWQQQAAKSFQRAQSKQGGDPKRIIDWQIDAAWCYRMSQDALGNKS